MLRVLFVRLGAPFTTAELELECDDEVSTLEDLSGLLLSMGLDLPEHCELFGEDRAGRCSHLAADEAVAPFLATQGPAQLRLVALGPLPPWRAPGDPSAPNAPLQAALAAACPASSPAALVANVQALAARLLGIAEHMRYYRDDALRLKALGVVPVARLAREAQAAAAAAAAAAASAHSSASAGGGSGAAEADAGAAFGLQLLQALLAWFKRDFFAWVDKPACAACGGASATGRDAHACAH